MNAEVSVLIPVRDPCPWLGEALQSVREQGGVRCDIVVVLDGPAPEATNALEAAGIEPRVSFVERQGLVAALNAGIDATNAPLIARLDADDRCRPGRLLRQVHAMRVDDSLVLLGSSAFLIDQRGERIGFRRARTHNQVIRRLRWRSALIHPSVIMRTSAVRDVGGYRPDALRCEDYELWLRLAAVGRVENLAEALVDYRVHPQQSSSAGVPTSAFATVGTSRLALAEARGESVLMAKFRQSAWESWNRRRRRR